MYLTRTRLSECIQNPDAPQKVHSELLEMFEGSSRMQSSIISTHKILGFWHSEDTLAYLKLARDLKILIIMSAGKTA
jgi:hypothetical protein